MNISPANKRRITFIYWSLMFCWSVNAYGLVGTWFQERNLLAQVHDDGHPYVADFVINYMAGQMSLACFNSRVNLYDPELEHAYIDKIIAPVKQEATFFAQNPPSFFLFNTPLGLTDPYSAYLIFCTITVMLIVASLYLLSRYERSTKLSLLGLATETLGSFPAWLCVRLGQYTLVFFPAVTTCFWAFERKKFILAGLLTGILSVKLQYLPMIGLIGLILGGYRYFFSALLSVALVISLSGMHLGWHNIIGYPNALKVGDSNKGVVGAEANHMENLRSLLTQLSGTDSGAVHMICWAVFVLAVLSVGYLWAVKYKRVQAHPFAFRAYASLTIVMMLVLSPHTHTQDYVFMSLPAVWFWQLLSRQDESTPNRKNIFLLALSPLTWILFLIKQMPMTHIPPFATVATCFGLYIVLRIFPQLTDANARIDLSMPGTAASS